MQNVNKKTVLVTGATGVIGQAIINHFQKEDQYNIFTHSLNAPLSKNCSSKSNSYYFDITNTEKLEELPNFDFIIHAAGYGQPKKFTDNPNKTFEVNTTATRILIKKTLKKFVFLSTSELYSQSDSVSEQSSILVNPTNKRDCYISGKLYGEKLCEYTGEHIETKIIRTCLCYGPGFKKGDDRFLYEIIFKALKNKEITLLDDGCALRSYIYIDDFIRGLANVFESGKHRIYNLGGRQVFSIYEIAMKIGKLLNVKVVKGNKIKKIPSSPDLAQVSIQRYEEEFGTLNHMRFEIGLLNCINHAKSLI